MSKWISVTERLPDIDGYGMDEGDGVSEATLIYYTCKDDTTGMAYRRVGHYLKIDGKTSWSLAECLTWDCLPKNCDELLKVTDWMPLPLPPNEK